jgi:predicted transposase YdaD
MPKLPHEALVQLIRGAPEMILELLQRERVPGLPLHLPPRVTAAEFIDLNLAEYRADVVLLLGDPERPSEVIVVEVQSEIDARKRRVWPIYAAGLRARYGCPVLLVVLAPEAAVATWCGDTIDLGHGRCVLRPLVLGPDQIPRITDHEVAVLSVAAHGREAGAEHIALAALAASHDLDNDRDLLYPDFVLAHLGEVARAALEQIMQLRNYEFQSEFFRKAFNDGWKEGLSSGLAEGEARGLAEGEARGIAEGEARGLAAGEARGLAAGRAEVLLKQLRRRFKLVDAGVETRLLACRDVDQLDRWAERVLDADSVAAVFAD